MLYIVATPIGNLKEMSYRAVETLQSVSTVLCEDTRRSRILLDHYQIKKPLISYQRFNERAKLKPVIERLERGEDLALISDAGMPLVSDPGQLLLDTVIEYGIPYTVVSGPCAAVSAAVLSGFSVRSFCLCGFLPEKDIDRRRMIRAYRDLSCQLLFYTPKHNIKKDAQILFEELGARPAALVREISKLHEEVIRFCLGDLLPDSLLGEFVLAVAGAKEEDAGSALCLTPEEHLTLYLKDGMDKNEAIKRVARERGVAKSEIYRAALGMK